MTSGNNTTEKVVQEAEDHFAMLDIDDIDQSDVPKN
jgi:hypothetical protein